MFFASFAFVILHTIISLIAIATGLVVLIGMTKGRRLMPLTGVFLGFTLATSVTGFLFPFHGVTPAIIVGVVATLVMVPTLAALYQFQLKGIWRPVYVVGAVVSLWFNCFVLVVQSFQKISFLHRLAPSGNEPAFTITQLAVLAALSWAGYRALQRYHPGAGIAAILDATRKAA